MEPKGIRNNNPLNIRRGKNPWVGEIWRYAQLNGYIRAFNSTQWGERALP